MGTPEEDAAAAASAVKATNDAEAAKAASDKIAADAAAAEAATRAEQTVPLSRLQAVIAQKAEIERAREALTRELKLSNDTLEEFRNLGKRTGDTSAPEARPANGKALSTQELQRLVADEAQKQNFNERCNSSVAAGRKEHTDFDKVVLGDLMSVSPVVDQTTGRPVLPLPLLEAALETGNAHEVLYALGQDVQEASRIMALRPIAQAVELAKFADKLADKAGSAEEPDEGKSAARNVSRAPAPIRSVAGKSGATRPAWKPEDTENFSTEEWIKNREKQIAAERAAR